MAPGPTDAVDSTEDDDSVLDQTRRTVLKVAGASGGALLGGQTIAGSAAADSHSDLDCVQVDFVTGTTDIADLGSSTYSGNGRLIQTKWGETVNNQTENGNETVDRTTKSDTCDVNTSSDLSIDFNNGSASVDYTLSNCGGDQDLLLVSYDSPCNGANSSGGQWDPSTANNQVVFDTATATTQSDGTLTVDIPPQQALKLYWQLNQAADADGNTVDASGNGLGSQITNGSPTYGAPSKVGSGSVELTPNANTQDDFIGIGDGGISINMTPSFSIAWWLYPNSSISDASNRLQGASNWGQFQTNPRSSGEIWVGADAGGFDNSNIIQTSGFGLSADTWQHIAFTYDENNSGDTATLYKNGTEQASENFDIGKNGTTEITRFVMSNWDGRCDDLRVYEGELSASEVQTLYDIGS